MWSKYPEIDKELELVEKYIKDNVRSRNRLLSGIVADLVDAGGKRLRPALAILSSKFGKYNREKVISIAGAIETLHTATLVHDDIVDRSKLRRGRVTVSEKYGSDMAVYTGDFLLTKAILMLSKDMPIDNLEEIAKAVKMICEGEVDQFEDRFNVDTTVFVYLKRIKRKTAVLFASACAIGSSISECPRSVVINLGKFGLFLGMAFQIRDDIYDILLNSSATGKPEGSDAVKGVITLPVIYSMRESKILKDKIIKLKNKKDASSIEEIDEIKKIVKETRGIEKSKELLEKYIQKGLDSLKKLPQNEYKCVLEDIIKMLRIE